MRSTVVREEGRGCLTGRGLTGEVEFLVRGFRVA